MKCIHLMNIHTFNKTHNRRLLVCFTTLGVLLELVLAWSGSGRAERLAVVGWETGGVTRPAAAVEKERERERERYYVYLE